MFINIYYNGKVWHPDAWGYRTISVRVPIQPRRLEKFAQKRGKSGARLESHLRCRGLDF